MSNEQKPLTAEEILATLEIIRGNGAPRPYGDIVAAMQRYSYQQTIQLRQENEKLKVEINRWIQRINIETARVDTAWKDAHNRTCAERDDAMVRVERLASEAAAYRNALTQILTGVTFSPPGIFYNGTGAHSFEAITDRAARANNLKVIPYPPKRAVWVDYQPDEKIKG